jgi:hypothetical protein
MYRPAILLLCLSLILSACAVPAPAFPENVALTLTPAAPSQTPMPARAVEPSASPLPGFTPTPLPSAALPTAAQVETLPPGAASLAGTVILAGDGKKPWATTIHLRGLDDADQVVQAKSGPDGKYRLAKITSGRYNLWVLVTTSAGPVSICADILPKGDGWKTGVRFGDLWKTLDGVSLAAAQKFAADTRAKNASQEADGFYVVYPGLSIQPGKENNFDITLQCK